jgi:hypothetical protein
VAGSCGHGNEPPGLLWRGDIKESWNELASASLGLEDIGRTRCNLGVVLGNL